MKKVIAIVFALALAVSTLAGCGQAQPAAAPASAPAAAEQSAPAAKADSNWPNKPITLVCPYSAGGSSDLMCRIIAEALGKELGVNVIVENETGGGGFTAWTRLYKTASDGYTITTMNTPGIVIGKYDESNPRECDFRDFDLICNHVTDYSVVAFKADEDRWTDFASFIEYAKENELLFGASNVGITGDDFTIAQTLNQTLGTKLTVVATEGAKDNETMMLNGSTDILIGNVGDVLTGMSNGTFVVGAVFAPERSALIPDVPTCEELGFGEIVGFSSRGYAFPGGTDPEILAKMRDAMEAAINNPETIEKMAAMGCETVCIKGEDYYKYLDDLRVSVLDTFGIAAND